MSERERLIGVSRIPRADIDALGDLDDEHYGTLRAAFEQARDRRERDLRAAVDSGLTVIPPLLRTVVRRMLFS